MTKEVENVIGSATIETNFATKNSNHELECFEVGSHSYNPATPLKPFLPEPRLVCEERHGYWYSEEGFLLANNSGNLASKSHPNELSVSQQVHFDHLLALANTAAPMDLENTIQLGNVNGASSSFLPVHKSQFHRNQYEAGYATSSPAKQDDPLELNLWSNNCLVPDVNLNGNSTSSRLMYDLNFPPTPSMDAFLIPDTTSQFAPITPDHSRKVEGKNVIQGINLDKNMNQMLDCKGEKPATTRVETMELQQFSKDLSSNIQSKKLQENHNVDKTEISRTPQQKPKRKKHRPKVVIEGKPERTPKPTTQKPEGYKKSPNLKRKYVQQNKINEGSTNAGPNTNFEVEKSCKRSLNFGAEGEARVGREDFISESQAQNFSPIVESTSKVKLGEGIEIVLENTQVGLAYDLNRSINKLLEEYILASDIQSINPQQSIFPQTPNKNNPRQKGLASGKSQIVFSEETPDKQSAPTIRNNLADDKQAKRLKRENSHDYSSIVSESWYNSNGILGMPFPTIYKKKRTDNIKFPTISKMVRTASPTNDYTSTGAASMDFREKELSLECRLRADLIGKMKRKRSKLPSRVRDYASLMRIIECGQMYGTLNQSPKSIETLVAESQAPMKKKKRTERLSFSTCRSSDELKKRPSSVEEITELMGRLVICNETNQERNHQNRELVPSEFQFENQAALVFYQGDGTIVPFMGPIKKRKPRPKVDLDEETNRVWMLLLENINSEGVNGTNEEKAKWWENERRVFKGRADSFIARMHLVQGDRRFSPWKGSVLDSVIGVFLTQNVSDHLSSSAFMSLAARFPLMSEDNSNPFGEGTSTESKVSEICILDLEDTANWKNEKPNRIETEKVTVTNDSIDSHSTSVETLVNMKTNFLNILEKGLQIDNNSISDREALDDALSSQFSAKSSKDSMNSLSAQPGPSSSSNYNVIPSFVELLQMVASSQGHCCQRTNLESVENCTSDQSAVTGESLSHIMVQHMTENMVIQQPTANIQSEIESSSVINIKTSTEHKEVESSLKAIKISSDCSKLKKSTGKQKQKGSPVNWDNLRMEAQANGKKREKNSNTMDSLDWEAVRCADVNEIADTIKERGMNNMLAERIKDFLNRLVKEHGSTDLEWLRDVPPDKAKEYLLSVRGLGLKSVECVRLLTLHHLAFPVDTNVGRIAVRLGWVPLQPLPELLQLHLLELYPVLESIQRYLWPRLCKLDQRTLYELHYQMITFGKVFCTKSKPNCNACPMRGECRHFASAFASARLALPGLEEKSIVSANEDGSSYQDPIPNYLQLQLPPPPCNQQIQLQCKSRCRPIIEVPSTPEPFFVEVPASPEIEEIPQTQDIEDAFCEDPNEIPTIKLNIKDFAQNLQNYLHHNMELQVGDVSKALVALTPEAASIPTPKLKNVNRLRTEHSVYELPDFHPLLEGMDKRERDDPCSYLLAIWTPGETASSITPPEGRCKFQELGELCDNTTCFSCNSVREANSQIVRGTILIPCRTAMRGSFPLNGTYFQVNEVFADHDSSIKPIDVPRAWIWNLPRRTVYFGTSIPSIFKGLSTECIQYCFWRGFVCVRGFDQKTRGPRPLMARLHFPASKLPRNQEKPADKQK